MTLAQLFSQLQTVTAWLCVALCYTCVYLLLPGILRVLQLDESVGQGRLGRIAGFAFLQLTAPVFLITCQLSQPEENVRKRNCEKV